MRTALVLSAVFISTATFASEPGQPLDCSDWVFLKPGLSCVSLIARGHCDQASPSASACFIGTSSAVDNESNLLTLEKVTLGVCFPGGMLWQVQLVRYVAGVRDVLAYITGRCVNGTRLDQVDWGVSVGGGYLGGLTFDPAAGRVLMSIDTRCWSPGPCPADYDGDGTPDADSNTFSLQLMAITGLPTLFEVLQTFTPQPAALGFRVPYMPEGMAGADHFDTYWGDLATVGNWSKAKGLQCNYPKVAPSVGDYLEVPDTLPTPAPGHGYYYVTAATYQGQTRYGRKARGGVLSGRDPALLPACVQ